MVYFEVSGHMTMLVMPLSESVPPFLMQFRQTYASRTQSTYGTHTVLVVDPMLMCKERRSVGQIRRNMLHRVLCVVLALTRLDDCYVEGVQGMYYIRQYIQCKN